MDGQNMGNGQNNQSSQYSNYQDNTSNVPYQAPGDQPQNDKANTLQIVSLICGIAGIVMGCCVPYVGIVLGIIGLICAILGNKQGKNGVGTGGLICSIIAIVLSIIVFILAFTVGMAFLQEYGYYY